MERRERFKRVKKVKFLEQTELRGPIKDGLTERRRVSVAAPVGSASAELAGE